MAKDPFSLGDAQPDVKPTIGQSSPEMSQDPYITLQQLIHLTTQQAGIQQMTASSHNCCLSWSEEVSTSCKLSAILHYVHADGVLQCAFSALGPESACLQNMSCRVEAFMKRSRSSVPCDLSA